VVVSAVVTTVLMLGSAAAFSSSIKSVGQARTLGRAATFLETTGESIAAQPYSNLETMDGNRFFDGADEASSDYICELTVFPVETNLLQLRLVLEDASTGRELARTTSLRSWR